MSNRPVQSQATSHASSVPYLQELEAPRAGVPPRYDDGVQWLASGLRRHRLAAVVGLLFGWSGAWIAFWGAMAGSVIGILVGFGIGNSSIPVFRTFGLGQSVSAVTVIGGVTLGFIGGFLVVLVFLVVHPLALVGSLVSGAILACALVLITASFERLGLRVRGYRRLSRDEVRQVAPLVKSAADAMDLSALPRFAMADQVIPNAWTHMRTIVLTTGILQSLQKEELEAVLIHELAHWRSGDSVGLRVVWAAAWPVALMYNLGVLMAGGRTRTQGGVNISVHSAFRWLVAWLIAWPAWVMVRIILAPLTAASQRRYEFEADAAAYKLGFGSAMASALNKLGAFESGRTGWEVAMNATHPPTRLRIEALQVPVADDWEYQEEELHGPSWREFRRLMKGLATPAPR
jgi:Zn-dependent protease with chaperone function